MARSHDTRAAARQPRPGAQDIGDDLDSSFGDELAPRRGSLPPLPRLWLGRRRWALASVAASSLAQAALVVTAALFGRAVLDREIALGGAMALAILVLLLVAVALLRRWQTVQAERLAQSYIAEVRLTLLATP